MKKILSSISFLGLLGISAVTYAGWVKFTGKYEPGQAIPNGDCLEMICEYGCVENDEYEGWCCSAGNKDEKCYGGLCCKAGLMCSSTTGEGICVECMSDTDCLDDFICNPNHTCECPVNTVQYMKLDNTLGCCNTTENILLTFPDTTSNVCCPKNLPLWDSNTKECVECLTNQDCPGELTCSSNKTCGCSTNTTQYTKLDNTPGCCNTTENVLLRFSNTTNNVCCPKNLPLWDSNTKECVECLTNQDCPGELTCSSNKTCGCSTNTTQYTKLDNTPGCCNTTENVLLRFSDTTNNVCCPKNLPLWDSNTKKCVECLTNQDCPGELTCNSDKTCGCSANATQYTKLDSTQACCDITKNVLATISNSTSNVCCPKNLPVWDGNTRKCVECLTDKDCSGELACNSNKTCAGCPDNKPVNRGGICISCTGSQVPNEDKTDCVCTNGITEEFCASQGQHLYDESCKCSGCLMCPKEKYNNGGYCETCPAGTKKTIYDFSKCQGKPKCHFDNTDTIGCCEIITASAYEHCQSGGGTFHGYKLGDNVYGSYDIEYVGGQWTCDRYTTWRPWCTTASSSCGCQTNLRIKAAGRAQNLYDHNSAIRFSGESYVYWADGPVWRTCGVSGDGCTDNCGKLSLLFQKVS